MFVRSGATTLVTLLAVLTAGGTPGAGPAAAQTAPPVPSGARLAAIAAPAVALVTVEQTVTITSKVPVNDRAETKKLDAWLARQQRTGRLARDAQSVNRVWLDRLVKDFDRYHVGTTVKTGTATSTSRCTGWFATPTGDLVTAAHCVVPDRDALLDELEPVALKKAVDADIAETFDNFGNVPLDAGMRRDIRSLSTVGFRLYAKLTKLTTTVTVQVPVAGTDGARGSRTATARVVSAGTPYPGRDVAVLHVDDVTNLPSLPLGDDTALRVGDTLSVDGFPGTVGSSAELTDASRREPSFTQGPVSAFRTTVDGVAYLQTQAPAFHGNSGGPVFGRDAAVVGILVAGVADPGTGEPVNGQEYVLRADAVRTELVKAGVTAVASPATTTLAQALQAMDAQHYEQAREHLLALRATDPQHPYVTGYLARVEQQIAAGHDRTPHPRRWLLLGLAAGSGLLVLVVAAGAAGAVLVVSRRRARPGP